MVLSVSPGGYNNAVAVTGTATGTSTSAALASAVGIPIGLELWGTWTGSVSLQRQTSAAGGFLPVTAGGTAWAVFTGNCSEQVWEETDDQASFRLSFVIASGTCNYRLAQ